MSAIKIDEKWTVFHEDGRGFRATRYGEKINFELDNLHFAMAQEIEALREKEVVTVHRIPAAPGLDPIDVYVERIRPGQSRITVRCFASSWTAYWGAHGQDKTVEQFVTECNVGYVVDNLMWGLGGQLLKAREKHMHAYLTRIVVAMQEHFKKELK